MEAECNEVAARAEEPAAPARAEGLCGIFYYTQAVASGDFVEAVAIHRQPGEIDRQESARLCRGGGLDLVEVDVARARVDVDEDRPSANLEHDVGGRNPGEGCRDDFVARADAGETQADFERGSARAERAHRAAA